VPNACNACHRKETPQWAADAIGKWSGKAPSGFQSFAVAFHADATSSPAARGALLALIDDASQPAIVRASALVRLGRLLTFTLLPSVSRALNDPDAVVRMAAVEALASTDPATRQRYLARMLGDPVRAVRVEATRALVGPPRPALRPKTARASIARSPSSSPFRRTTQTARRDEWALRTCMQRAATRRRRSPSSGRRSRRMRRLCPRTRISRTCIARGA
jgi:HEAT repeat protein